MSTALQLIHTDHTPVLDRPIRILPVPWRDPHTVSPGELKEYIIVPRKSLRRTSPFGGSANLSGDGLRDELRSVQVHGRTGSGHSSG